MDVSPTVTPREKNPIRPLNDDHRFDPSRWWFASSAFPMIAGTLGPVANAFSICALVRPWRQVVPAGTTKSDGSFAKDPSWLIIVNAIQLALGLVSNLFLLLNMARRVRFSIAQPVTIVGW
jgi:potassium channel subfamily K